jgi:hypothetical protein
MRVLEMAVGNSESLAAAQDAPRGYIPDSFAFADLMDDCTTMCVLQYSKEINVSCLLYFKT